MMENIEKSSQKVTICLPFDGELIKLLWVNESSVGIYTGHIGPKDFQTHFSWHKDGNCHTKVKNLASGEEETFQEHKKSSLDDLEEYHQFLCSSIPIIPWIKVMGEKLIEYPGNTGSIHIVPYTESMKNLNFSLSLFPRRKRIPGSCKNGFWEVYPSVFFPNLLIGISYTL